MEKVYTSKIDRWLMVLVLAIAALSLLPVVSFFKAGDIDTIVSTLPGPAIALSVLLWLMVSTKYTLTDTTLLIKSGPFKWRVPVKEISGITPTSNPLSSPAMSLDRLRIDYGRYQSVMISPKHKAQFIQDLESRRAKSTA